jgi:Fe-S-cluster containining protein
LDGPCCWFNQETGLCQHHAHRPNVCREFEPGSSGCREWRIYYGVDSKARSN